MPLLLLGLVMALFLAGAERLYSHRSALSTEPGRGASWIWAQGAAQTGDPVAFYAVRDVEMESDAKAWMTVIADETFTLWINGRRVGSGGFRASAPADFFDISDELIPGVNRIMIEVSSSRGAGGLMASLRVGAPDRPVLGTDESWRIFRHFEPSVFAATRPLAPSDGDAPVVWQKPSTGRWRPAEALALKPGPPHRWRPERTFSPIRLRYFSDTAEWRSIEPGEPLRKAGAQAVFDFGRDVLGHLEVAFDTSPGPALLYFDAENPELGQRPPDAVLLPVDGSLEWRDPYARRFRYVTLVATAACHSMQVSEVTPERAARQEPPSSSPPGVFGLRAPSPIHHAEELVWSKLRERATERARRERAAQGSESGESDQP